MFGYCQWESTWVVTS